MTNSETLTSYDIVPYKSHPFSRSHPDRLATIATLFGLTPAPVERCRVLELGCASGGNLLPMADQYPGSTFVGIDASSRQIQTGQELLLQSQLKNVELRHQDILQFTSPEPFDYIICHGVFSWVPDAVQQQIFEICQRYLSPQGVAYVSYNTYPGWHMRGMIRDIMRFRARSFDDPRQKLSQARGLVAFLSNSVKGDQNPYAILLKQELETISRSDDFYLQHEHLEEVNEPLYFHEFAERAGQAGLQYLGEADFGVMSVDNFPEQVRSMLLSVSRDTIDTEQYMDFLRNRSFRQTLLCRQDVTLDRTAQHRNLIRLRVASNAKSEAEDAAKGTISFRRSKGTLTTGDKVVQVAMAQLQQAWPASVPFAELSSSARSKATGRPVAVDSEILGSGSESLAKTMLRCFATSMVDLRQSTPQFVPGVSEQPQVSALVQAQVASSLNVTNRLHETVVLDDIQRQLVAHCDGQHSLPDLMGLLADAIVAGELILYHDGQRVTDRAVALQLAQDVVPTRLQSLADRALFTA